MTGQRTHQVGILGIPFDEASSFLRGAAEAPPLIRREFHSDAYNSFAEDGVDLSVAGVLRDFGDISFAGDADPLATITRSVEAVLAAGAMPLLLGGDHSITYPVVRAVAARHESLSIVHIDAHPDLYDVYEGNRFSHACPFARIMEAGLARQLTQIGIRAATAHQREQAKRFDVHQIDAKDLAFPLHLDVEAPIYLSVDLDALDPAFAPGVSHREPGGLSVRELLSIISSLKGRIIAADIVEYNPSRDVDGCTAAVAAKLVREIASAMLHSTPS